MKAEDTSEEGYEIARAIINVKGRNLLVLTESLGKEKGRGELFQTEVSELASHGQQNFVGERFYDSKGDANSGHEEVISDVRANPEKYTIESYVNSFGGLDPK